MKRALLFLLLAAPVQAEVVEYHLEVSQEPINITGQVAEAMLINGQYPGPVLRFRQGDTARIHVTNATDVDTSMHWHGLLLPPAQDGVPYVSNWPIRPGETFTFEFPLRQAGTYWYHSHTDLQEQSGVHAGFIIEPREPAAEPMPDAVVVLQDWTDEHPHQVLHNLKKDGHYYARKKDSVISLAGYLENDALGAWWDNRWIRMGGMDIADVGYDAFLANGKHQLRIFEDAEPGSQVKLRLINAATSSYFYLHGNDLPLTVVGADGLDVEPVEVEQILHAIAETYDIVVTIPEFGAVELRATAQDISGYASIIIGPGPVREATPMPLPDLYQSHAGHMRAFEAGADDPHAHHQHHDHSAHSTGGAKTLAYEDLVTTNGEQYFGSGPVREIRLRLTGNMETFNWTFNDTPMSRADRILIERGEVVRMIFRNETMMHHPLHLHGHFFRVLTGPDQGPFKHTVDVKPLSEVVIEFYANEEEDWFFHCHNLYHSKTGMGRFIRYADYAGRADWDAARMASGDIKDMDWYFAGGLSLLSQHQRSEGWVGNNRHTFMWEVEIAEDYENEGFIGYYHRHSRFLQWMAGVEFEEHHAPEYRLGVHYVLPLMIEAEAYITDERNVEVAFETDIHLTDNVVIEGEWETTDEYRISAEYKFTEHASVELAYFDDVKFAAGVMLRF